MGQKTEFNSRIGGDFGKPDQSSFRGHFLIAMPSLTDPMFAHTITYICDHNADGALGIVINHPLDLKLGEVFRQLKLPRTGRMSSQTVLSGGPVQIDRGFVLHPKGQRWESTVDVSADVSLTASRDILESIAADEGPEKALVALGYAGWDAGQLEEEIAANSWLTVPAENHILFDIPSEQRWAAASKYLGIDLNLISSTAGHA
ncbi:YqgE/AlgH family protein [Proteobacteria bacterium 005FR1]|nr:YqgE/AlgH family protein [Proteobacteria bacterium 005FR1]